ncbi:Dynein-related AAA-type ATPase [Komagataella phaffii CBS 7435]|uniref:Midasin n=2 Tax=Komagataella phaffii TaxID=460519 RepID=C4QWD1_KOMPG|nr:Huge dynein-related AAA-type ATPase (midasin), forms extended pre-60S particle with the Rix1 complex [Komagataella phaffii GS115]AOA61441.1 GQ67_02767T0 [Komagataella phaffii]CAH2446224.1 Dynein-related AAA-type ATPase [Komagataella phaffii CBS 7435]AOA66405.1 GQ68_02481T0 [Komagataella phaffii GS115]CAY67554.1 Huge dynein-related AAA-type ATPase (midasin), forms extended pre-60S particle with the Rix1 complex [Komagataella phaffii GS115]CCA36650.1 Dynein-related AAA-type ATPase [Komagatael
MDNPIRLDLQDSLNKFKEYFNKLDLPLPAPFLLENESVPQTLNTLAMLSLNDALTLPLLYGFKPIYIDIIGRLLSNQELENSFRTSRKRNIPGSDVLATSARVIQLLDGVTVLIDSFLNKHNPLNFISNQQISQEELQTILIAFHRLLVHDTHRFKKHIDPVILYQSLENQSTNEVNRYLLIQLLSSVLNFSEQVVDEMMISFNVQEAKGSLEGDIDVSFRFLSILEANRLSRFTSIPEPEFKDGSFIVQQTHLSSNITSVGGILIPYSHVSKLNQVPDLVPIQKSLTALKNMAINVQQGSPFMIVGKPGSGKSFLVNELAKQLNMDTSKDIIKVHLNEQTDSKMLLGTYTSGTTPGSFVWKDGILTTAVKQGKWILVEDIDKAPTEVLSILLSLLEKKELTIPSRGEVITATTGFQIISTIRQPANSSIIPDIIGMRLWKIVLLPQLETEDLSSILTHKFPTVNRFLPQIINCFLRCTEIFSTRGFITMNKGHQLRILSLTDLVKLCSRTERLLALAGITSSDDLIADDVYDSIFQEAVDCFCSSIPELPALEYIISEIGLCLNIPSSKITLLLSKYVPVYQDLGDSLKIGRAHLSKTKTISMYKNNNSGSSSFAKTNHALRLMEQISVAVSMAEPVLLVGETGTGKTTVVQHIAKQLNKKIVAINVSQQTEVGDLLGGYKPVNTKLLAIPIQETFEELFYASFSVKKNARFLKLLAKCFNKSQWKNVFKLWKEAHKMAKSLFDENTSSDDESGPTKKRKLNSTESRQLMDKWNLFLEQVSEFEKTSNQTENSFVFQFIEGTLVKAVRNGYWLLLDEINLASPETLECISDLLSTQTDDRNIVLAEKGSITPIKAHPDFRLFGNMNPGNDVGKKNLPANFRSRWTELWVHSPDSDISDLLMIIDKYVGKYSLADEWVGNDIAQFYLEAKKLAEDNKLVDGANQKPHFSIRTLTRSLIYVTDIVSIYGLRRSLYEAFCMSFLTLLDADSEKILRPLVIKYTISRVKNFRKLITQCPPNPSDVNNPDEYVQFRHYWMKHGPGEVRPQPHYIITPFVEKNMLNLVRATSIRRFPVLIQGPTSSGKTSMIKYLANITGHKFVRINNHEHTDLQEYLGSYVSDDNGKLAFKEGVLVEALRKGYWIVLDELNLAPTDVLEALNRLLDDNRELFIPETQEFVTPHPDFMLFATQNPPGIYGGRKVLSRAFRNRFLELHYDDIPQDELEIILKERCQIAPSYATKIVQVYQQLSLQRQSTRLFEQKNSFATLRDLFRWAEREAIGYEQLAANGYMLLAERVRRQEEKLVVKETLETVMKVRLDMDQYYKELENPKILQMETPIVWTKAMRRLAVLVSTALKNHEPILLVGETGCGKTSICQLLAELLRKELIIVNAHQNTETGDLLGAQRPIRNRSELQTKVSKNITDLFNEAGISYHESATLQDLLDIFDSINKFEGISEERIKSVEAQRASLNILFEWTDGPLVQAMKNGEFFLLDEISLADDSVLERLNSVLEPEKTLLLAEKGAENSFIQADKGFEFLATMNPGGDYGKKELSPALRNRFTEIFVPSMDDLEDVHRIVASKLIEEASQYVEAIVKFSEYYALKVGNGNRTNGVISLRDILAWVNFINTTVRKRNVSPEAALIHGCCLTFIDALGTNNTASFSENPDSLAKMKLSFVKTISELSGMNLLPYYEEEVSVELLEDRVKFGQFYLPRVPLTQESVSFNLKAPTTAKNAMRVTRALQVHKPILLEGSPGVGKTSLVTALAKVTGNLLTRINLSEQTDLLDLFGSDAPAEGGQTGEFVWRDAPFLRAMKKGEWVLLDEMNLASQSVLEGLNACLDHRGEAYIPELDKTFPCHPNFVVFAAQNPQYQGGGRKGLPKSFINRFTVVYVEMLSEQDLNLISQHLYPKIDPEISAKLIKFISSLESEIVLNRTWGSEGGPWEFNLRDTLRWLQLYSEPTVSTTVTPGDYLDIVIGQRFRNEKDRTQVKKLFTSVFGEKPKRPSFFALSKTFVESGRIVSRRRDLIHSVPNQKLYSLQCNYPILESLLICINHAWPVILTGATDSGKSAVIQYAAGLIGSNVHQFSMNSDIDSMDILGGYEQVDLMRGVSSICNSINSLLLDLVAVSLKDRSVSTSVASNILSLLQAISSNTVNTDNFNVFVQDLSTVAAVIASPEFDELIQECILFEKKIQDTKTVKFEWFDGLLVKAVEQGDWLILDNANLCNASVLDRLNSLLEPNGVLVVNESSSVNGEPRIIVPHKNFRLFITTNPKYGELSRAMRNRCIEIFLPSLEVRASKYDRTLLGDEYSKEYNQAQTLEQEIAHLEISKANSVPISKFVNLLNSESMNFARLVDFIIQSSHQLISPAVAFSLLQLATTHSFEKLSDTICSSLWFSRNVKANCNKISDYLSQFKLLGLMGNVFKIYDSAIVPALNDKDAIDYQKTQYLNPTVNPFLLDSISRIYPYVDSVEANLIYVVGSFLVQAERTLSTLVSRSITKKLNDLNYLERSAAVNNGREVRNAPPINIFKFLKDIQIFLTNSFIEAASSLFSTSDFYTDIFELQVIWIQLYELVQKQDEAKIRVFQQLVTSWFQKCSGNPVVSSLAKDSTSDLNEFNSSLALTRGFSIEKIWESFRTTYPSSEVSWSSYEAVCKLSKDFDSIAQEQFSENANMVQQLRLLLIELHSDSFNLDIESEDFDEMQKKLTEGIEKFQEVSSGFINKRKHTYRSLFQSLLAMSKLPVTKDDAGPEFFRIAHEANMSTELLFKALSEDDLKPFPRLFHFLWTDETGAKSHVSKLFTDELFREILTCSFTLTETEGKDVAQNLVDFSLLTQSLIKQSPSILEHKFSVVASLLRKWTFSIILSHTSKNSSEYQFVQSISTAPSLSEDDISKVAQIYSGFEHQEAQVFTEFIHPVLIALNSTLDSGSLGKAFVSFALGTIQLYVPSSPHDPAITDHVIYDLYHEQLKLVSSICESLDTAAHVSGFDVNAFSEKNRVSIESSLVPSKPQVYRPKCSIDALFEDWNSFVDSSAATHPVQRLVQSLEDSMELFSKKVDMFQRNASQFLDRLQRNHSRYADLNDILAGYIYSLKFGFDLLNVHASVPSAPLDVLAPIDATVLSSATDIVSFFDPINSYLKNRPLNESDVESVYVFFMKIYFSHADEALDDVLIKSFQGLYYRWSLFNIKKKEEESLTNGVFKYAAPEFDGEEEYKTMFPDYEEVVDYQEKVNTDVSKDDVYYEVASAYIEGFAGKRSDLNSLISEGSKISQLLNLGLNHSAGDISSSKLASLAVLVSNSLNEFNKPAQFDNFYFGFSSSQTKLADSVIQKLQYSILPLLKQWPEHAVLQQIHSLCDDLLSFPVKTPIAQLLQKVEHIYVAVAEWEKYAHSKISLKAHNADVINLVVSWRKLELSSWQSIFEDEDKKIEKNIGKWWFHLFELTILPIIKEEYVDLFSIVTALNVFLSQTTLGEFELRVRLIEAFANHANMMAPQSKLASTLNNMVTFYEQFLPNIRDQLAVKRRELEKKVKEMIILTSFKDVNVHALQQSSRHSHAKLFRIVKKYRELLAVGVSGVIESGLSANTKVVLNAPVFSKKPFDRVIFEKAAQECLKIPSYNRRPEILKGTVVLDRVSSLIQTADEYGSFTLYEYAKEILQEMERLKKQTPNEATEENKKIVGQLKSQKRKLLSDTLKEVRRLGLKLHVTPNVSKELASVNQILSDATSFRKLEIAGTDGYFFRVLDLFPRLRASVAEMNEEVPVSDGQKALAAVENLMYHVLRSRNSLNALVNAKNEISSYQKEFQDMSSLDVINPASPCSASSFLASKSAIKSCFEWIPKILNFASTVLQSSTALTGLKSVDVFGSFGNEFEKFQLHNKNLLTTEEISTVNLFNKKVDELHERLLLWKRENPLLAFVADLVIHCITSKKNIRLDTSDSFTTTDLDTLQHLFSDLTKSLIVVFQKFMDLYKVPIVEDDDGSFKSTYQNVSKEVKLLHSSAILGKIRLLFEKLQSIGATDFKFATALNANICPLLTQYYNLILTLLNKQQELYVKNSHALFILTNCVYTLTKEGFCSPQSPDQTNDPGNMQDGTGLGDGDGATNSKDIDDDEDFSEQAQEANKEKDDNNDDEAEDKEDDAVDIEGDMAGDLEESKEKDNDDEDNENSEDDEDKEMDEELDDIDDLDPNAVDEKMWEDEAQEDSKEKDSDKMPDNSKNDDDNMEAMEEDTKDNQNRENPNKQDENDSLEDKDEQEDNAQNEGEEQEEEEEEDVGEQEDEVKNDDGEKLDDFVPDVETLELPDDLQLEGEDDKDDTENDNESQPDDAFDDPMNMDVELEENNHKDGDEEEEEEEEEEDDEENGSEDEGNDEVEAPSMSEEKAEEEAQEEGDENMGEDKNQNIDEDPALDSETELNPIKDEEEQEETNDPAKEEEAVEGLDGVDEEGGQQDNIDDDAAVKQEAGISSEGAEAAASEERDDMGASGGAAETQAQDEIEENADNTQDPSSNEAKESLKQLGDSLKEYHRRRQEIKEANDVDDSTEQNTHNQPDEYQHLNGENTELETQALGAADKDQIQTIDDNMAIDDEETMTENLDTEQEQNPDKENDTASAEDIDDHAADGNQDMEGDNRKATIGERKINDFELGELMEFSDNETEDEADKNEIEELNVLDMANEDDAAPRTLDEARDLWRHSDLATQDLAANLCEQLRLILEPTVATKLRGDYKTGKRLNMKRIIPYIASQFRKDKIWLRRTKPSKRQHQIMIAVDDSKSMSESKSVELAFHSIALVAKALTQLESGSLSVVRFGEDTKVVHPFNRPFTPESGAHVFQWFDFQQTKTDIQKMCSQTLKLFNEVKADADDLWQLQIILSDGVCEDHATVQRLVRRAREDKIMLVFVVIDGINSNESILDMSQVQYVPDANGNMQLKVERYLDTFPFEFYVVVHNINELPEMLSLILRQFFSEIAGM